MSHLVLVLAELEIVEQPMLHLQAVDPELGGRVQHRPLRVDQTESVTL